MTWFSVWPGRENDVCLSEAGWSQLDEIVTCENFVCLKKITLSLVLTSMAWTVKDGDDGYQNNLGIKRNSTLFPMFRASSSQRTLETYVVVV